MGMVEFYLGGFLALPERLDKRHDCLELRKWRYAGADPSEVVRRLRRVAALDRLDEGPDAEGDGEA